MHELLILEVRFHKAAARQHSCSASASSEELGQLANILNLSRTL